MVLSTDDELEKRRFDRLADAHFRPWWRWTGRRTHKFAATDLAGEFLTPVVLAVATALLGAVSASVVARLERSLGTRRRTRRRGGEPAAEGVALPAQQQTGPDATELARLWDVCLAAGLDCGTPEEQARRIADSMLARLVRAVAAAASPPAPGAGVPPLPGPDRPTEAEVPADES